MPRTLAFSCSRNSAFIAAFILRFSADVASQRARTAGSAANVLFDGVFLPAPAAQSGRDVLVVLHAVHVDRPLPALTELVGVGKRQRLQEPFLQRLVVDVALRWARRGMQGSAQSAESRAQVGT